MTTLVIPFYLSLLTVNSLSVFFDNIIAMAQTTAQPTANVMAEANASVYLTTAANAGVITRKQAAIWIPIILAIITIASVYALYAIDDIKSRDTILYAKFLANLKDR